MGRASKLRATSWGVAAVGDLVEGVAPVSRQLHVAVEEPVGSDRECAEVVVGQPAEAFTILNVAQLIPSKDFNVVRHECTALHDAARFGHLELCKLLVSGGASTTIVNKEGQDAHATALEYGKPDVAAFLEECKGGGGVGAPVNARARVRRVRRGTARADGRFGSRAGGSLEPRLAALCAGRARGFGRRRRQFRRIAKRQARDANSQPSVSAGDAVWKPTVRQNARVDVACAFLFL